MPRIARTMATAFGLLGGLVASQGPEFAQQYRQRLGGAIDELSRIVRQFDADATATGQDRNGALGQLRNNPDRIVSLQGEAMRGNIERLERLQHQREAFTAAGPFERLIVLVRQADTDIVQAAYRDFEPAVPATNEGILSAVIGFLLGWSIARLVAIPLRRMFVRRPRRLRGEPI